MVLKQRGADFLVKMTKCRLDVHTDMSREVVADTPTDHASKLAPVIGSSSAQRGILIGTVSIRKLGTLRP